MCGIYQTSMSKLLSLQEVTHHTSQINHRWRSPLKKILTAKKFQ